MGIAENKDVVGRIYEDAINNHNLNLLDNYILSDYVNQEPRRPGRGQAAVLDVVRGVPDVRVSVDSLGAEGDRVWVRTTMRGTHQGPFMGMPPTGRTFAVTTVNEVRLENGKVVEEWGVTDTLAMWQQLGLVPQATS
jgi:predicted ester cyclase